MDLNGKHVVVTGGSTGIAASRTGWSATMSSPTTPTRHHGDLLLSNTPRRMVEAVLIGTNFPKDWEQS